MQEKFSKRIAAAAILLALIGSFVAPASALAAAPTSPLDFLRGLPMAAVAASGISNLAAVAVTVGDGAALFINDLANFLFPPAIATFTSVQVIPHHFAASSAAAIALSDSSTGQDATQAAAPAATVNNYFSLQGPSAVADQASAVASAPGVSEGEMNARLADLESRLVTRFAASSASTPAAIYFSSPAAPAPSADSASIDARFAQLSDQIGLISNINALDAVAITNATISGNTSIDVTGSISATGGLSGSSLSVSDATATSTFSGGAIFATSGGSVGIGTSSPVSFFSVSGKSYFSDAIGINTANPTAEVDVSQLTPTTQGIRSISLLTGGSGFIRTQNDSSVTLDVKVDGSAVAGTYFGVPRASAGALLMNAGNLNIGTFGGSDVTIGTNNAAAMTIKNGGFVGFGTTTPGAKVAIAAAANIQASAFLVSTSTVGATSTAFVIDRNGLVGIGTSSPYAQLSVAGLTASSYFSADNANATSTFAGGFQANLLNVTSAVSTSTFGAGVNIASGCFSINNTCIGNQGGALSGAGGNGQVAFWTGGSTFGASGSFFWDNSNNRLGLGTSTPNWPLQVSAARPSIAISDSGAAANLKHWLISSMGGNLYVGTSSDAYATTTTAALTILNNGRMGIGTATPGTTFAVAGSGAFTGAITGYTSIRSTTMIATSTAGQALQVGGSPGANGLLSIGTTSAGANLLITDNNPSIIMTDLQTSSLTTASFMSFRSSTSTSKGQIAMFSDTHPSRPNYFEIRNIWNAPITFLTNNRERMKIDAGGSVGIGTSSPGAMLSVADPISSILPSFMISTSSLANGTSTAFMVDNNGRTGIGGTSTGQMLTVYGGVCVTDGSACPAEVSGNVVARGLIVQSAFDLAESYPTSDRTLSAGEIVAVDAANPTYVKRAENGDEATLLGIISTHPGFTLGTVDADSKPVALAGRVPVKVNLEGGAIAIGDRISLSSVSGVGKKAAPGEASVGTALSTVSSDSTVVVFVQNRQYVALSAQAAASGGISMNDVYGGLASMGATITDGLATFKSVVADRITASFASVDDFHAKSLCLDDICITKTELKALLDKNGIAPAAMPAGAPAGGASSATSTAPAATSSSPISISVNGDNPATINVGDSYLDLGATLHDLAYPNIGIVTAGDSFDTSIAGSHVVTYTVTDPAGNSATSTRTVNVVALVLTQQPSAATSTAATSTPSGN